MRLFSAAFGISLSITLLGGWQSWRVHGHVEEMSRRHIALTEDVGSIMLFDEALTMSARMAAATGDFSYEKRYDEFDSKLTAQINAVRALLPQAEIASFVAQTDEANLALVKMERQAFALTHRGLRQEATALLISDEYMRLKKIYAEGMEKTVSAANRLIETDLQHLHMLSLWLALLSAAGTLLLLATWFFAIRSARSWARERIASEEALRNTQDELVRREKLAMLGQIAGSVGHELRNPLGVMSNAVYFLQSVLSDADETTREYLSIINDEIAGSERIVSDLLDSVRTKPSHPENLYVLELIENTLRKFTVPSAIAVKLDIPTNLPALRVDAMQINQVFRNLFSNALEAMPEGGTLEIRANENRQDGTVTIKVMDSGVGMTPEQIVRLFQPLFTTKARGIGLGLVVVKNLTLANGGMVAVQSEHGKGTAFSVTLPSAGSAE